MAEDDDIDTGDLLVGLKAIARYVGVSPQGVRYLWAEGRVPVVKLARRGSPTAPLWRRR